MTYRDEHRRKHGSSREEARREREADLYASTFLIPEAMLEEQRAMQRMRRALSEERELFSNYLWRLTYELARVFRVSPTMMKNRLVYLKVMDHLAQERQLQLSSQGLLLS